MFVNLLYGVSSIVCICFLFRMWSYQFLMMCFSHLVKWLVFSKLVLCISMWLSTFVIKPSLMLLNMRTIKSIVLFKGCHDSAYYVQHYAYGYVD